MSEYEFKNLNEIADFFDKMAKSYRERCDELGNSEKREWGFYSQFLAFDKAAQIIRKAKFITTSEESRNQSWYENEN